MFIKLKPKNKYATIPNCIIEDTRLSCKDLGVFCYLQSRPETWEFSAKNIAKSRDEGVDMIVSALRNLESLGYLRRNKYQDELGHWKVEYILDDSACSEIPVMENPVPGNPVPENPVTGKTINNSKKGRTKKDINNKEGKIDFLIFWNAYGKKKGNLDKIEDKWYSFDLGIQQIIMAHVPKYVKETPNVQYRYNPSTYLNGQMWRNDMEEGTENALPPEVLQEREVRYTNMMQRTQNMEYNRDYPMKFHEKISVYHLEFGMYDQLKS